METIKEAQDFLSKNIQKGVKCPCCHQFTKVYRRKITSSMARVMILILKWHEIHGFDKYVQVNELLIDLHQSASMQSDFPKLRFWGLLEPIGGIKEDGSRRVGYWRLTDRGVNFAKGEDAVKEYVYIFNNKVYATKGDAVGIRTALGSKFKYSELMQ